MRNFVKLALAGAAAVALFSSNAFADGMPSKGGSIKDAPMAHAKPFSWSGIYIGGHIGGGWAEDNHTVTWATVNRESEKFAFAPSSWVGGVQAGVQRQLDRVVLGLEASLTGGDFADKKTVATVGLGTVRQVDIDWIFALTPRIGLAMDNWMLYAKGGYATAEIFRGTACVCTFLQQTGNNHRFDGWTVGGGFEVGVMPNISLGLDYSYFNFGAGNKGTQFVAPFGVVGTITSSDVELHTLTARINFKLGH